MVARGKKPGTLADRMTVHVRVASGKSVAVREDGRADFREQDKITRVAKGDLLVTLRPAAGAAVDGWDVTGGVIPAPRTRSSPWPPVPTSGRHRPGWQHALFRGDGRRASVGAGLVDVRVVHEIAGDVGLTTGNVKFSGTVRVSGSVLSGFSVVADGDIIAEVVQAAFLAAGGSVEIGRGIKGEGKAIVRAKAASRPRSRSRPRSSPSGTCGSAAPACAAAWSAMAACTWRARRAA